MSNSKYEKYFDKIKECYCKNMSAKEIIKEINSNDITKVEQIYKIANKLGISKESNSYKKFADIDKKAISLIKNGMSCTMVAKKLSIDQQSLSRRLSIYYDIHFLPDGKKKVDSYYFHDINSEEKAYWLGFLYADGYVDKNKNSIELALSKTDREHLVKFKSSIHSDHKISNKSIRSFDKEYEACRISIKDKQLCDDLKKHGCINAKSFSIEMPLLKSKEMYKHFMRGFFDGDGHIEHRGNYIAAEITCASLSFCESIALYAQDILGIKFLIKKNKNRKAYTVTTTARAEGYRFLQHLYSNSTIYLNRKYNQFCDICRLESILPKILENEDGIKRGWRNVD